MKTRWNRVIMLAATLGLALTVSLSALVFASNSGSGSTTHNESSGKSYNVDKDYEYYASRFGVTVDEAKSQLILQKSAGVLGAELSAKETSSFAGLYLKHSPDFRVVILLTGDEERISTQYVSGSTESSFVEFKPAVHTMAELEKAQANVDQLARLLGIDHHTGIDVENNKAVLYVPDPDRVAETLKARGIDLPDAVTLVQLTATVPVSSIEGGLRIDTGGGTGYCTSGFPVFDLS